MAIRVFAWPPVGVIGRSWQLQQPVARLRSALTGRDQMQASQRARRMVQLDVSALARGQMGGGYMEVLGRALEGGINAVRINSWSPNRPRDMGSPYDFLSISLTATATTSGGLGAFSISGLPPHFPLFRPGDRFRVTGSSIVRQALNEAVADASGVAIVRVFGEPAVTGTLVMDAQESAVFRPEGIPTGLQVPGRDWTYSWTFREVFEDEVGGFEEFDPWN